MKTSINLILLSLGLLAFDTNAANTNFNHKGIQNGAISESLIGVIRLENS